MRAHDSVSELIRFVSAVTVPRAQICLVQSPTQETCHDQHLEDLRFRRRAFAILAAANLEVKSHGRDKLVTQVSYVQPTFFETNAGSDAAISTYGLDPQRTIDW